jgi:predicted permease
MISDLRIAFRTLARAPLFTSVAIASLALGIGANTAIFSVLDHVLLRPMPVCDPGTLAVLHCDSRPQGSATSDNHETVFSLPIYRDLRDRTSVFDGVVARGGHHVSLGYGQETDRGLAEIVSGNYFRVLCVRPILGRVFSEQEDTAPDAHPVAVLTYTAWQRRFASNRGVVNQTIRINSHPFTIIGVLPAGFNGLLNGTVPDVIVPLAMSRQATPQWDSFQDRSFSWVNIFARLKPGVSLSEAEAASRVAFRQIRKDDLDIVFKRPPSKALRDDYLNGKLELLPAAQGINEMSQEWKTPLIALMAMVGLVLLIACANVANLLVVRAARRQKEIAIRISLGAARGRIIGQLFMESMILAVVSGLAGILVAAWLQGALLRLLPANEITPGFIDFRVDHRLLLFAAAVSLGTAVLFGFLPAWQASRQEVAATLKAQASAVTSGTGYARTRKAMVLVQVALATVLIVMAGLFARSSSNLLAVQPGFHTENVLTFGMDARLNGYDKNRGANLYSDLLARLREIPGITSVAAINPGPLTHSGRSGNITVEGYQAKENEYTGSSIRGASPGYFATLQIPVIAGREFNENDRKGARPVAIVNQAFAKKYFAGANAVGHKMMFGGSNKPPDTEIVGLVHDYKHGDLREEPEPAAFLPLAQDTFDHVTFYIRSGRNEKQIGRAVREAVRRVDPSLSLDEMQAMKVEVDESVYRERLVTILAMVFGGLATLLAAIGVYGVIAYMVARRTNEFGIRVALGAMPAGIIRLVVREVAAITIAGVLGGTVLALAGAQIVQSQLYGVRAHDPLIYTGAAILIALIALAAAVIPARRAASVNPITALRYE